MHAAHFLLWLLATQAAPAEPPPTPPPAPAPAPAKPAAPPPASPAPPPPPPPPPPRRAPSEPPVQTPFRLSLTYSRVLAETGELANTGFTTNAIGIDMAFPSGSYVRNHLGLAHQWESAPGYSARGFRIDLISLGYPIDLVRSTVRLDLEPVLTVLRGEILFVDGGRNLLRLDGAFGLDLSVAFKHWFLGVQPEVNFRYLVYSSAATLTGFGRLITLKLSLGHEF